MLDDFFHAFGVKSVFARRDAHCGKETEWIQAHRTFAVNDELIGMKDTCLDRVIRGLLRKHIRNLGNDIAHELLESSPYTTISRHLHDHGPRDREINMNIIPRHLFFSIFFL
jgi:hypothetical protein